MKFRLLQLLKDMTTAVLHTRCLERCIWRAYPLCSLRNGLRLGTKFWRERWRVTRNTRLLPLAGTHTFSPPCYSATVTTMAPKGEQGRACVGACLWGQQRSLCS